MLLRQSLQARTDVVQFVDFAQDCLENHGYTAFSPGNPKMRGLQMDWLRSEDLKEEKGITNSVFIVTAQPRVRLSPRE